jgi:hypothetical protein
MTFELLCIVMNQVLLYKQNIKAENIIITLHLRNVYSQNIFNSEKQVTTQLVNICFSFYKTHNFDIMFITTNHQMLCGARSV